METFNIFKVLGKDDKELIHSSFIRFLLTEFSSFYHSFLRLNANLNFEHPVLEKSYSHDGARKRIDIEVTSTDNHTLVVIENKFKSFPYKQQLCSYDEIYNHFHPNKQKHKFLFCFDKALVSFASSWTVFDYSDLLKFIQGNCLTQATDVKQIFIRQYYEFLAEYFDKYKMLKQDSRTLFLNSDDKENKFWLRLLYSALHLKLNKHFEDSNKAVRFDLNQGNTKVPLINIVPAEWNLNGKELLIQFQGNDVKFYSHSNDKNFIEELVSVAKENFDHTGVDFKELTKRNAGTYFIFKTKLTNLLANTQAFTLDNIDNAIWKFYIDINDKIIKTTANNRFGVMAA